MDKALLPAWLGSRSSCLQESKARITGVWYHLLQHRKRDDSIMLPAEDRTVIAHGIDRRTARAAGHPEQIGTLIRTVRTKAWNMTFIADLTFRGDVKDDSAFTHRVHIAAGGGPNGSQIERGTNIYLSPRRSIRRMQEDSFAAGRPHIRTAGSEDREQGLVSGAVLRFPRCAAVCRVEDGATFSDDKQRARPSGPDTVQSSRSTTGLLLPGRAVVGRLEDPTVNSHDENIERAGSSNAVQGEKTLRRQYQGSDWFPRLAPIGRMTDSVNANRPHIQSRPPQR